MILFWQSLAPVFWVIWQKKCAGWCFGLQNMWYFGWYFFGSPKCVNSRWFWRWYYFGSPAPKFCSPLRRNFVRPTVGCDFCPAPKFCSVFCLVKRRAVFLFDFECEFKPCAEILSHVMSLLLCRGFLSTRLYRVLQGSSPAHTGPHGSIWAHMGLYSKTFQSPRQNSKKTFKRNS